MAMQDLRGQEPKQDQGNGFGLKEGRIPLDRWRKPFPVRMGSPGIPWISGMSKVSLDRAWRTLR